MRNIEEIKEFLSMLPGGVYCCDPDGTVGCFNSAICAVFGCADEDELSALSGGNIVGLVHPEDASRVASAMADLAELDGELALAHRIMHRDGGVRWVRNAVRLVRQKDGICRIYGMMVDETQNKERQDELYRIEERLRILADIDNDIIFDMDCKSGMVEIYGDFGKRFGREPTAEDFQLSVCGVECDKTGYQLELHHYAAQNDTSFEKIQHDIQLPTGDGRMLWCRHQSEILRDKDGRPLRHIGRLLNADDIKAKEEALLLRAQHDPLTGVHNREAAQELIERILWEGNRFPYVMMVLDLDNFKHINDTYGHPAGDWVLCKLAMVLKRAFRLGDIIGRLGGDEFMVFLSNVKSREKVFQRVSRLCVSAFDDFDRSIIGNETVTFSLGAACSVQPEGSFAELYELADKALYESKRNGKGLAFFWDLPEKKVSPSSLGDT